MPAYLKWNGRVIAAKMMVAAAVAVNRVMVECVVTAQGLVRIKTGTLRGSIRFEPASPGLIVRGLWGSFDVNYAIYQEMGTYKMSAQPYLRPAAEMHYPKLAAYIGAAL